MTLFDGGMRIFITQRRPHGWFASLTCAEGLGSGHLFPVERAKSRDEAMQQLERWFFKHVSDLAAKRLSDLAGKRLTVVCAICKAPFNHDEQCLCIDRPT